MFYEEYVWKKGFPVGRKKLKNPSLKGFKIISDPYHKRVSIEHYQNGLFDYTIYDSLILDFRQLHITEQTAWRKEVVEQSDSHMKILIRDMDDRIIFIEHQTFEQNLCRKCDIISPHGYLASTHQLYYENLGDPFNGVILFDANQHPVMIKKYTVNEQMEFTDLIEEEWNIWQKLNFEITISL